MFIFFSCKHSVIHQLQINVVLKAYTEIMRRNKGIRTIRLSEMPCVDIPVSKPY